MILYKKDFPRNCYAEMSAITDMYGKELHILMVSNGKLSFSVLPERGMDIGEVFLNDEKISWERTREALLHPDNVDLHMEGGWDKGFFGAVAVLGPEVFGTPDEVRTVHGTGSYSPADLESIQVFWADDCICVEGRVDVRGYERQPVYAKTIRISLAPEATAFVREERTENCTGERQPLDDGYHVQLAGDYMSEGGSYVLPTSAERMLLRDSAPKEENPKEIYPFAQELNPIRCYQYIPEKVQGLQKIQELKAYDFYLKEGKGLTAEMLVNKEEKQAAFVIRPLGAFPRSLLAKRAITEPMYALEPCKTRPNSIRQKEIDGELVWLEPFEYADSWIMFGVLKDTPSILRMKHLIEESY